jgi:hypothetical protein
MFAQQALSQFSEEHLLIFWHSGLVPEYGSFQRLNAGCIISDSIRGRHGRQKLSVLVTLEDRSQSTALDIRSVNHNKTHGGGLK